VLDSFDDGQEVIASELPDLAGETDTAIGEQDLSLADAAGVEEELTRGGVARRALVAEAEVKPTGVGSSTLRRSTARGSGAPGMAACSQIWRKSAGRRRVQSGP
jgi:hypothetical protein